uniref:Uncharacterized protein n=1 Tax=Anguilla anguilla TaxID=7936 RepID=A0A0E9PZZ1_ANGAN
MKRLLYEVPEFGPGIIAPSIGSEGYCERLGLIHRGCERLVQIW